MKALYLIGWVFDDVLGTAVFHELTVSQLLAREAYDRGWDEERVRDSWGRLERLIADGYSQVWEQTGDDCWGEVMIARDRAEVRRQMNEWAVATGFGELVA